MYENICGHLSLGNISAEHLLEVLDPDQILHKLANLARSCNGFATYHPSLNLRLVLLLATAFKQGTVQVTC